MARVAGRRHRGRCIRVSQARSCGINASRRKGTTGESGALRMTSPPSKHARTQRGRRHTGPGRWCDRHKCRSTEQRCSGNCRAVCRCKVEGNQRNRDLRRNVQALQSPAYEPGVVQTVPVEFSGSAYEVPFFQVSWGVDDVVTVSRITGLELQLAMVRVTRVLRASHPRLQAGRAPRSYSSVVCIWCFECRMLNSIAMNRFRLLRATDGGLRTCEAPGMKLCFKVPWKTQLLIDSLQHLQR